MKIFILQLLFTPLMARLSAAIKTDELGITLSKLKKTIAYIKELNIGIETTLEIYTDDLIALIPEGQLKDQIMLEYSKKFNKFNGPEFLQFNNNNNNHHFKRHAGAPTASTQMSDIKEAENLVESIKNEINDSENLIRSASETADELKNQAKKINSADSNNPMLKDISEHLKNQGEKLEKQVKVSQKEWDGEVQNMRELTDELAELFVNEGMVHNGEANPYKVTTTFGNFSKIDNQIGFLSDLHAKIVHLNINLDSLKLETLPIFQPAENIINIIKSTPEPLENKPQEMVAESPDPKNNGNKTQD